MGDSGRSDHSALAPLAPGPDRFVAVGRARPPPPPPHHHVAVAQVTPPPPPTGGRPGSHPCTPATHPATPPRLAHSTHPGQPPSSLAHPRALDCMSPSDTHCHTHGLVRCTKQQPHLLPQVGACAPGVGNGLQRKQDSAPRNTGLAVASPPSTPSAATRHPAPPPAAELSSLRRARR